MDQPSKEQSAQQKPLEKKAMSKWEDDPSSVFDPLADQPKQESSGGEDVDLFKGLELVQQPSSSGGEVKAASSLPPPTNVNVSDWGQVLHAPDTSISGGKIVVTKGLSCQFPITGAARQAPAFPSTLEIKVKTPSSLSSWFAIGFVGAAAPKAHWRQYIYRTATIYRGASPVGSIRGNTLIANMADMPILFTDPTDPVRSLDAGTSAQPYYDMHLKTAKVREDTRVVMLDQPGGVIDELHRLAGLKPMSSVQAMAELEAARYEAARKLLGGVSTGCLIRSTASFDTYLCIEDKPRYHVSLTVMWEYTCQAAGGVSFGGYVPALTKVELTFGKGEEVDSIPSYKLS